MKHENKDMPVDLWLEVSKLTTNVGSTAAPFRILDQDSYTKDDAKKLVVSYSMSKKRPKQHNGV